MEDIFRAGPTLLSEDDCAENVVVPFLQRLGYERGYRGVDVRRKVTISGFSGKKFRKQADVVVYLNGSPGIVIETKRLPIRITGGGSRETGLVGGVTGKQDGL